MRSEILNSLSGDPFLKCEFVITLDMLKDFVKFFIIENYTAAVNIYI